MKLRNTTLAITFMVLVSIALSGCGGGGGNNNSDPRLEMIDLINRTRSANGLPALNHYLDLSQVAQAHSEDMVARNYLGHINPEGDDFFARVTKAGIAYNGLGENVSAGFQTMDAAHDAFMNSTAHRENILRAEATDIGVGYTNGTAAHEYGTGYYICVLFMQR